MQAKRCLRYANPSFSIFKKEMTDDEEYLLKEALSMLGQFDEIFGNTDAICGADKERMEQYSSTEEICPFSIIQNSKSRRA